MKRITLTILSIIVFLIAFAKDRKGEVTIDTSRVEILYLYRVTDPVKCQTKDYNDIFQYGDSFSRFFCYNYFLIDSILCSPDADKNPEYSPIHLNNKYHARASYLEFDRKDSKFIETANIGSILFQYEEERPEQNWTLTDSSMTVCGHECMMAQCTFRGRRWTAWYTEEIPVNFGPWKLGGLPGLILRAEDATGNQFWEAISIRKGGNPLKRRVADVVKVSRERFLQEEKEYAADPIKKYVENGFISGVSTKTGKKLKCNTAFYSPLELE